MTSILLRKVLWRSPGILKPQFKLRSYSVKRRSFDDSSHRPKVTLDTLRQMYLNKEKIVSLTAYDFPSATFADRAGCDIVLVGDSLGMVCLGYEGTNQDMVHHSRAVHRALKSAFHITDLPFATYESSPHQAFESAATLVRDGFAEAVKLEGGKEMSAVISHLTSLGIPVMGHVGLTPQRAKALGGFRVQGNTALKAERILEDAHAVQEAGAFMILLEAVPSEIAKTVTNELSIPTIGTGAGIHCSGQGLVQLDMLGAYSPFTPRFIPLRRRSNFRFVKFYESFGQKAIEAVGHYIREVKTGEFPVEGEHTYPMTDIELQKFKQVMENKMGGKN